MRHPLGSSLLVSPLVVLVVVLALAPTLAHAFFEQFFQHSEHHQQAQAPPTWDEQLDAVSCSTYICPDSLSCVATPADCPCPSALDTKCALGGPAGEGAYVCARDCAKVRSAERAFGAGRR